MSSDTWGEIKTSYRVVGEPNVDEFAGICAALGLRPHQLVRRLVTEGIARHHDDPDVDKVVRLAHLDQQRAAMTEFHRTQAAQLADT